MGKKEAPEEVYCDGHGPTTAPTRFYNLEVRGKTVERELCFPCRDRYLPLWRSA